MSEFSKTKMVKNKKLKGLGFNAKARKGSNKDLYKELLIKQKENKSASESAASTLGEFENTVPQNEEELLLQSLQQDKKEKILDHELIKKLNMNSKKRKRFEKFMEKELKKDERRLFYDKLRYIDRRIFSIPYHTIHSRSNTCIHFLIGKIP